MEPKTQSNTKPLDLTIRALVEKKKELLQELLRHSIQSMIHESGVVPGLRTRSSIIMDLETTETNLIMREKACEIDSREQEKDNYCEIKSILEAIRDNNDQLIIKMEKSRKSLERERLSLEKENKVSGYINQRKGFQRSTRNPFIRGGYSDKRRSIISGTL